MTHQNALNSHESAEARRAGIHLVHSRTRQQARVAQPIQRPHVVSQHVPETAEDARKNQASETLLLAAAALTAPGIWVGHAILRAIHVL